MKQLIEVDGNSSCPKTDSGVTRGARKTRMLLLLDTKKKRISKWKS